MLLFSPRWLFLVPGVMLFAVGLAASAILAMGPVSLPLHGTVARIGLDVHTLVVSSLLCLVGYQLVIFAVFTKVFAVTEHLHPMPPTLGRLFKYVTLEVGLVCGVLLGAAGFIALAIAFAGWARTGFWPPRAAPRNAPCGAGRPSPDARDSDAFRELFPEHSRTETPLA